MTCGKVVQYVFKNKQGFIIVKVVNVFFFVRLQYVILFIG